MALSIGRVSSFYLPSLQTHQTRNGALTLSGKVGSDDPTMCHAIASQIIGLSAAIDEPVMPVVFSGKNSRFAHLNGFYRVTGSEVGLDLTNREVFGQFPWNVSLEPVPDRSFPMVETRLDGGFRANSVSIIASGAVAWHAVPGNSLEYTDGSGALAYDSTLASESGNVWVFADTTNHGNMRRLVTWSCGPEDWYGGGCSVQRLWGTTWLPVIGRDLLSKGTDSLRITNGLLRAEIVPNANGTILRLSRWSGTAWVSATDLTFYNGVGTDFLQITSAAILTNSPGEVRVRLTGRSTGSYFSTNTGPATIDLHLRRGAEILGARWTSYQSTSKSLGDPIGTYTSISGARYLTAADGAGNKFMETFPISYTSSPGDLTIGVGFVPGSGHTAAQLRDRYFAPLYGSDRIVGR
jgi:hypothetical protein